MALWLQWLCNITWPDSTYFELKVLIVECATLKSYEEKKICWISQQGTEKSIFRVIFQIGFDIMATMILQNNISRFNLFQIESFDSWVCYFGELRSKICWMSQQGNREEHFQSNLLNWLWHYDCNDSAKYHFQIQLISNWKFW